MRWLVSNVPKRTVISLRALEENRTDAVAIQIDAFDESYDPLDNAKVNVEINEPGNKTIKLQATPTSGTTGKYSVVYRPKNTGAYSAKAIVTAEDGSEVGQAVVGWVSRNRLPKSSVRSQQTSGCSKPSQLKQEANFLSLMNSINSLDHCPHETFP